MYATVKSGKLTVSANMDYSYYDRPTSYSGSTRKTIGNITESSSNIESEGTSKYHGDSKYGSIEASYEIDSLRLITAAFDLYGGSSTSNGESWALATSPLTGNQLYSYNTLRHSKSKYAYVDGGIDYQRTFKTEEKLFTLSYRIGSEPDASDSYTDYADLRAADGWEKFIERLKRQRDDGSENTVEHTFQVDYTTPFAKHHTIETGLKYILRNNTSEDDRYEMDVMDYEHSSHYKHRNDILAAYLGYGLKIKKLSGRLGLRYEHTLQDVEYKLGPGTDFSQHFNDLVPSASLGLKLGQTTNLRLGYNLRIYRPSIWYLNPYLDDSTPTNINQGNPNLDSEKSHNISFTFSKFTPKFNINLTTQYTFTNNSIENVVKMMRDTDIPGLKNPTGMDVLYTSYENIGRSQSFNLNAGWAAFAYGGAQQTLPKDWNISLNFYAYTPSIMLQGRGSSYSNYTLSIQKSWMKKRLNLTLSASNFLKKYKTFDYQTTDTYFEAANWSKSVAQRFAVTVSYRIGELKASVRKAERSISNDDVKSGGGSGNSGGSSE